MALVIAGERSGVGKTTVTLTLLASLCRRRSQVQSFKVGPDYIDPMFHQHVTKRACRNLDPVLTSETYVRQCFARHSQDVDYALVEGVMGLFDGISSVNSHLSVKKQSQMTDFASTAHIARLLDLPVVLVIDCSRLSGSVAAIAHGYRSFDPRVKIAGVVLNRVGSDRHLQLLKDALELLQIAILGVLRRSDNITIPDRHLGLVPSAELAQLDNLIDRLANLGETCFDWKRLLPLLKTGDRSQKRSEGAEGENPTTNYQYRRSTATSLPATNYQLSIHPLRVAIARDRAFNFYYQDNLDLLQQLGAELVPWSPLVDPSLPENIHGLYFGGGFPEVFAQELAANTAAMKSVQTAIQAGIPTYAECGGLMYLSEQIIDFDGKSWQMVGAIPTNAVMGSRLTLGYRQATAVQDSPLVQAGNIVWGHEFHRSHLSIMPTQPLFQAQGYDKSSAIITEGWRSPHLHASYIHLHFGGNPEIAARFLQQCDRRGA
ncbi:MAG TPA: cobyrinate a,c-diamide synthase [Leptolyngbyaceae cyanobacterium]